ncbi:MAG: DUF2304 family protein [Gemmataceae bacterium]
MSNFQWLVLALLVPAMSWDAIGWLRGVGPQRIRAFRLLTLLAAALAIYDPELVSSVAAFLGIGRGADAVLYFFVLAFLATSFFLYSRIVRQQMQITELVRHLALREARQGSSGASPLG